MKLKQSVYKHYYLSFACCLLYLLPALPTTGHCAPSYFYALLVVADNYRGSHDHCTSMHVASPTRHTCIPVLPGKERRGGRGSLRQTPGTGAW